MKTNTNIKRRVKHSIKHRAQRKYKTHKNKHTKTHLKQHKTHRGGAGVFADFKNIFSKKKTEITPTNLYTELSTLGTSTATDDESFGFSEEVKDGISCHTHFLIEKILQENKINIDVDIDISTNDSIKNILLALFIKLAQSVNSKQHCLINIKALKSQYFRRLMTNETYVSNRQGIVDFNKLFHKFIENVIVHKKYRKFNGKNEDILIKQLQDWVDAIEVLLGFEAQYKPLLVSETLNLNDAQDILKKLKEHCNTQSEASNCTDFNPCCNINKENKDNNVANKSADLLVKENQTMLLQTIKLNKNELKLEANERLIIKNNIANSMYTWLKSTDNLEAKYNLYIKSQDYKNLQITLPFKLQAGVAIS